VSLTGSFKYFFNGGESVLEPMDLGLPQLSFEDIRGGSTVEESAKVFMDVLEGKGTASQNAAVVANAGMALYAANQQEGILKAIEQANEALVSGRALESFTKLMAVD
jgi:anthranilate phosphoribosyltransferase